jgi:predicted DNA-binding transcriptional regulator AlpA
MRVDIAAHYMGVSESTFLSRVKGGTYPPGRKEIGLVFWLRDDLDGYIDRQFAVARANDGGSAHDDPFAARFRRAS